MFLLVVGGTVSPVCGQPLFRDVTEETATTFLHTGPGPLDRYQGTGAAWFDYDRDGDLDLYITRRIGDNALFENQGDGTFKNVATARLADDGVNDGAGVAVADYDNDGWLDIFLANTGDDAILHNAGGTYEDVTPMAGVLVSADARGTSAAWGDYDRDGFLDLYVAHHSHVDFDKTKHFDFLLRNNGNGTFSNVTRFLPPDEIGGYAFIGAWTDIDDDGDADILLINDCPIGPRPEALFRNDGSDGNGGWVFTSISAAWGVDVCRDAMGLAIGDYDRDGRMDYLYSNIGNVVLLHNDGYRLIDVALAAGIEISTIFEPQTQSRWTWGANFIDYDLDGWEDIYIASGAFKSLFAVMPNVLMHNRSDGTFEDMTLTSGCDDSLRSRTSVFGDYDGDGDPDIYVVNYMDDGHLYRNENENGNKYLILDLEGTKSNRNGIGARVRVRTADGSYQYREIRSGSSLGGSDDIAAYFGLGSQEGATEVVIRWPSGIMQKIENLAAGRHKIQESGTAAPTALSTPVVRQSGANFMLEWSTSFENGIESFTVEKLVDGGYTAVATLDGGETALRPQFYTTVTSGARPGVHTFRVRADGGPDPVYSASVALNVPAVSNLSVAKPNPFRTTSQIDLTVASTGRVTVTVYDALGRRVAVLFDGDAVAGTRIPIAIEGGTLPAGVYLVRATGPDFALSEKVTLLR